MATRLMVTMSHEEAEALALLARAELRDPREQLLFLLRQELRRRNLLPEESGLCSGEMSTRYEKPREGGIYVKSDWMSD